VRPGSPGFIELGGRQVRGGPWLLLSKRRDHSSIGNADGSLAIGQALAESGLNISSSTRSA
jgi:hypothetical protein